MTITKVISYFISLAMISVILWAQNQTSLFDSIIPTLPWGIVSLVDLYSGFILIAIWMIYREKNYTSVIWVFFLMILGNLTTAVYVIYCINNSKNDIKKFFLGKNIKSLFKLSNKIKETSLTLTLSPSPSSFTPSSIMI